MGKIYIVWCLENLLILFQKEKNKIMSTNNKKIVKNTAMLMLLNFAKLIFPFITLPYLTRVMSTDCYGVVAYVKAVMVYMQVIVDFGFSLSATKMVVEECKNQQRLNRIVSLNLFSKLILSLAAFVGLICLIWLIPLLKENALYTILSYNVVFLTVFLFDFLFRGMEMMHIITIRFVVMKFISTFLTFVFVKGDEDIYLIPLLDIVGSIVAVILVFLEVKKLNIKLEVPHFKECLRVIKESADYFWSNVASTSFNVFNTFIAGIALSPTEVAYWSVCMQIINAIQAGYTPVSDAIYPEMVRSKNIMLVSNVIKIFGPLIMAGSVIAFGAGKWVLLFLGGNQYVAALPAFRRLIPVLLLGFLSIILGWPSLGAIGKVKETSISTVVASIFQITVVMICLLFGKITLISMAVIRSITELILFSIRLFYFVKYRKEFKRGE